MFRINKRGPPTSRRAGAGEIFCLDRTEGSFAISAVETFVGNSSGTHVTKRIFSRFQHVAKSQHLNPTRGPLARSLSFSLAVTPAGDQIDSAWFYEK
ncbi:hypothetical protein NL676_019172 [Syzygium grande]|nr:hypothetical protein NL676_019172 [Syzygium grande]